MSAQQSLIRFALGLLVAAIPATADAAVYSTTSGAACKAVYDNTWPYGTNIFFSQGAAMSSDTVNPKYFTCPVHRLNPLSTTGTGAYVSVYDAAGGVIWCSLSASDIFGNVVSSSPSVSSGAPGPRLIGLPNVTSSAVWGSYNLFCVMPKSTGGTNVIYSYLMLEN